MQNAKITAISNQQGKSSSVLTRFLVLLISSIILLAILQGHYIHVQHTQGALHLLKGHGDPRQHRSNNADASDLDAGGAEGDESADDDDDDDDDDGGSGDDDEDSERGSQGGGGVSKRGGRDPGDDRRRRGSDSHHRASDRHAQGRRGHGHTGGHSSRFSRAADAGGSRGSLLHRGPSLAGFNGGGRSWVVVGTSGNKRAGENGEEGREDEDDDGCGTRGGIKGEEGCRRSHKFTASHPKEVFNTDVKFDEDAIWDGLFIPRTPSWSRSNISRLVVNQEDPSNKYLPGGIEKFLNLLPAKDWDRRFRTCAVVGNSGVLTLTRYGAAIERHDAVFRFNNGPTGPGNKFVHLVGNKTTVRFINNNWAKYWMKKRPKGCLEENIVLFGISAARMMHSIALKWKPLNTSVLFLSPEFAGNARGMYKRAHANVTAMGFMNISGRNSPPTGIEGVFFAMEVCDTLHVYGFGMEGSESAPYHYYDEVQGVEAAHSFGFQRWFLSGLAKKRGFVICSPGHAREECDTG
eukprot:jgi/Mesvir1/17365/Mv08675-RA.1